METSEKPDNSLQPRDGPDEKPPLDGPESQRTHQNVEPPQTHDGNPMQSSIEGLAVETPPDSTVTEKEKEWEYITGFKALIVLAAVTLAAFLMLLDNSIIATVSLL